jgi:CubicO group peptidase (beta-lactamase class C family)
VPGRLARVEQFIQGKVDDKQLPGAVVLLARHGRVATLRAFGAADLATGRRSPDACSHRLRDQSSPRSGSSLARKADSR